MIVLDRYFYGFLFAILILASFIVDLAKKMDPKLKKDIISFSIYVALVFLTFLFWIIAANTGW